MNRTFYFIVHDGRVIAHNLTAPPSTTDAYKHYEEHGTEGIDCGICESWMRAYGVKVRSDEARPA